MECREIKFGALLDVLPKKDRHFLATGHYGRVAHLPHLGASKLLRATDQSKDQTYYLSQMTEPQLSRVCLGAFPFVVHEAEWMDGRQFFLLEVY